MLKRVDLAMLPASVVRDASQLALPAATRVFDASVDARAAYQLFTLVARLNAHAPPPLRLPLRI